MITADEINEMIDCGDIKFGEENFAYWVKQALLYLPEDVVESIKNNTVFLSTCGVDAWRVARRYICEKKEIIMLSERIFPKYKIDGRRPPEDDWEVRYFNFVVLHEIAHAIKNHDSPKDVDSKKNRANEIEADDTAMEWFNLYSRNIEGLIKITKEEIKESQEKHNKERKVFFKRANLTS